MTQLCYLFLKRFVPGNHLVSSESRVNTGTKLWVVEYLKQCVILAKVEGSRERKMNETFSIYFVNDLK